MQLSILCSGDKVTEIIETITSAGRTGNVGDGKITVTDLEKIIRIRTGEEDANAL